MAKSSSKKRPMRFPKKLLGLIGRRFVLVGVHRTSEALTSLNRMVLWTGDKLKWRIALAFLTFSKELTLLYGAERSSVSLGGAHILFNLYVSSTYNAQYTRTGAGN